MRIHRGQSHTPPWQDESKLRKLYSENQMLVADIADKWKTTPKTIGKWLNKHGIERRDKEAERLRGIRSRPANYEVKNDGYERWTNHSDGNKSVVYVHRLLAVAEYGFETVKAKRSTTRTGCRGIIDVRILV